MSGIYIHGMDMPTSCGFCPFENHTDDGYECRINRCLTEYQKRPSDCPLVPVPPHGRLIDADELYNEMAKRKSYGELSAKSALRAVANAPTIIPAEED